ncbi:YkgJ family cysteine cluster protein [Hyphomicrobium sp. DY-1]|uniref:YkgJ family cysteine cluster protein n=1 Tax=Hyphomicrobium sp. DY-1 TaxID=3075650 RepID=UPI0039C0AF7C
MPLRDSTVICAGCRLCCQNRSLVPLLREYGDRPEDYETQTIYGLTALAMKSNGDCVYLGDDGCTIYDRRPIICRKYDCAEHYRSLTRAQRKEAIAQKMISKEVLAAGRARQSP